MNYNSIAEACRKHALAMPEKICVIDNDGIYTYAQVWRKANELCKVISDMGFISQDRIVVECTQDASFLLMAMACQIGNYIFVPVEANVSKNKIKEIYRETDAKMLVCNTRYELDMPTHSIKQLIEKAFDDKDSSQLEDKHFAFAADSIAEILYTTGTTGKPKGILITNWNNVAVAENIIYGTKMADDNVELIPLPLSHSHGLRTCYAGIVNGSTLVIKDGVMNVSDIYDTIRNYHVTSLDLSPSAAKVLLKLTGKKLSEFNDQFDYIEIGTAFLDEEIKAKLREVFPQTRLYNFYGSTEAGRTCILEFGSTSKAPGCIGHPTKHARFIVIGEDEKVIDSSRENMGLLAVSGDMMMKGYWKDQEASDKLSIDKYMKASDIGYIDQEGFIYVFGRADDIINYKGIKISPEEIEEPALKYDSVIDCACVPLADSMCGFVPKLYVQVGDDFDMQKFREYLSGKIDQSRFPKNIEVVEQIPRTYNGKLQRSVLREKGKRVD